MLPPIQSYPYEKELQRIEFYKKASCLCAYLRNLYLWNEFLEFETFRTFAEPVVFPRRKWERDHSQLGDVCSVIQRKADEKTNYRLVWRYRIPHRHLPCEIRRML